MTTLKTLEQPFGVAGSLTRYANLHSSASLIGVRGAGNSNRSRRIAMTQTAPRTTSPSFTETPTLAQQRAFRFVSARIADADASQWHGGYIHGLIQALNMAGAITVNQACALEQAQDRASCNTFNRRAAGGAA